MGGAAAQRALKYIRLQHEHWEFENQAAGQLKAAEACAAGARPGQDEERGAARRIIEHLTEKAARAAST